MQFKILVFSLLACGLSAQTPETLDMTPSGNKFIFTKTAENPDGSSTVYTSAPMDSTATKGVVFASVGNVQVEIALLTERLEATKREAAKMRTHHTKLDTANLDRLLLEAYRAAIVGNYDCIQAGQPTKQIQIAQKGNGALEFVETPSKKGVIIVVAQNYFTVKNHFGTGQNKADVSFLRVGDGIFHGYFNGAKITLKKRV